MSRLPEGWSDRLNELGRPVRTPERPPPEVGARPRRRRHWGRRITVVVAVLLALLIGLLVWMDTRLNRVDALSEYDGRPAVTPGTDWLIVGSDSRAGLSGERRKELATGEAAGRRADTMMLLHLPRGGGSPTLVSLPRDSYVPIPGHKSNKLNAAYAFGGAKLLSRTVENATGIRIDHYMEVGFDGFATAVGALVDKATSPGVLLNPFKSIPLALRGTDSIAVDDGDHINHLVRFPFAMRAVSGGGGVTTTVPVAGSETVAGAGSVLRWDRTKALALFDALKQDRPVPTG